MKATMIAGLAALTLSACSMPQYKTTDSSECEMYGSRISAKVGYNTMITNNCGNSTCNLIYPKGMSLERATKAIETCERAFKKY